MSMVPDIVENISYQEEKIDTESFPNTIILFTAQEHWGSGVGFRETEENTRTWL